MVVNMATILTQVADNARSATLFSKQGSGNRIRFLLAPSVAQGGDMINING
jgi:hypothetical protein